MKYTLSDVNRLLTHPGHTRREFVTKLVLVPGAALVVSTVASSALVGQSCPKVVVRKNVDDLDPTSDEIKSLKKGVEALKAKGTAVDGWTANAKLHEMFCSWDSPDFQQQIHFGWWFLPWHRAYLHFTEKKLQNAAGDCKLALPYWDWNKSPKLPANYLGSGNPLNDVTREKGPTDEIPELFLASTTALNQTDFRFFGGGSSIGTQPGTLELNPHNPVHGWVGGADGNMGDFATAALDPIFFAHHGNIDRLWAVWIHLAAGRENPDSTAWLDKEFPFTDPDGGAVTIAVKDVLDTEKLGYRYDNLDPPTTFRPAAMAAAADGKPNDMDIKITAADRDEKGEIVIGAKPVTLPLSTAALQPVIVAALEAGPETVTLEIEQIQIPAEPVNYSVFINNPDATHETEITADKGYVGTFSLVPAGAGVTLEPVSVNIVVPRDLRSALISSSDVKVTVVPISDTGGLALETPGNRVTFRNVSISFSD